MAMSKINEEPARPRRGHEPVLSLEKGLEHLALTNRCGELSVADAARHFDMPRTTCLRILETLREAGYLSRDERTKRYRPTIQVRALADGYQDEQWVLDIARASVGALAREVVWPVLIATPAGTSMLWRENTDYSSPLALARYSPGFRVPIVTSAGGHVFLAYCTPQERRAVLRLVAMTSQSPQTFDAVALDRKIAVVRREGYAVFTRRQDHEGAISVPILSDGRYLASLTMRYIYGAVTEADIVDRFLPRLLETSRQIGDAFDARFGNASLDPSSIAVNGQATTSAVAA